MPKKLTKKKVEEEVVEEEVVESLAVEAVEEVVVNPPVEESNYTVVTKGGKQYKKFSRPDGTTDLELITD